MLPLSYKGISAIVEFDKWFHKAFIYFNTVYEWLSIGRW
jgi:hypothetical protein